MKNIKKIMSICLIGSVVLGGSSIFAGAKAKNATLTGSYTTGSNFKAQASTIAPSTGLRKISVGISSNKGHNDFQSKANLGKGTGIYANLTGSGATYIYSDHIWSYTNENEEMSQKITLQQKDMN